MGLNRSDIARTIRDTVYESDCYQADVSIYFDKHEEKIDHLVLKDHAYLENHEIELYRYEKGYKFSKKERNRLSAVLKDHVITLTEDV